MYQAVDASAGGAFLAARGTVGLAGVSLLAAAVAATVVVRETDALGRILAVLGAGIGGADHWQPQRPVGYQGNVFVTIVGAGATVILYQA